MNVLQVSATVEFVRTARGRIHAVYVVNGSRNTHERCNLDDAKVTPVDAAAVENADRSALCRYCFPVAADA